MCVREIMKWKNKFFNLEKKKYLLYFYCYVLVGERLLGKYDKWVK